MSRGARDACRHKRGTDPALGPEPSNRKPSSWLLPAVCEARRAVAAGRWRSLAHLLKRGRDLKGFWRGGNQGVANVFVNLACCIRRSGVSPADGEEERKQCLRRSRSYAVVLSSTADFKTCGIAAGVMMVPTGCADGAAGNARLGRTASENSSEGLVPACRGGLRWGNAGDGAAAAAGHEDKQHRRQQGRTLRACRAQSAAAAPPSGPKQPERAFLGYCVHGVQHQVRHSFFPSSGQRRLRGQGGRRRAGVGLVAVRLGSRKRRRGLAMLPDGDEARACCCVI